MWLTLKEPDLAKVCIMTTGGTISSIYDDKIQAYRPGLDLESLLSTLPKEFQSIDVVKRQLFQIDSANAQPHHWKEIVSAVREIHEEIPDLDGFVILHGTDTMVYSATAMSFMVQDFGKPIIFTGSQIPASIPWSDGPRNLVDALRVAAWGDVAETCIVFNGEIHRANRTRKIRERALDAFDSVDGTPMGFLARDIALYENRKHRHNLPPKFDTRLNEMVFLLKVFPGMKPSIITKIVKMGYQGIVIEGFGSGNIPTKENGLTGTIKQALDNEVVVVMSTQCAFGQADLSLYEVGKAAKDVGALSAYDMTSEAAVVKLMWILAHTRNREKVREMMYTNYAGEITFSDVVGLLGS